MTVVGLVMAVVLSVAPAIAFAQARDTEGEPQRVVILNAADPYLPAFIALDGALRDAIRAGSGVPPELYAETLDMHRFPRLQLDHDVAALLRKKYDGLKVDVVVAAAPIALDFARLHRADIWPGATIVFHSVPAALLNEHSLDPRTIGIPVQLDFGPTLDLALSLRPATRRVAVVAGTADPDRRNLSLARAALERHAGRLEVEYLVGLTLAETIAAVRALHSHTVVLYLTVYRDGAGVPLVPRDVLTLVAASSPAPVFGIFETYLGDGIAAGSIASYGAQGRSAGELVLRVLNGDDPSAIGIQEPTAPACIADWRQLHRWGIDEGLLPADCEIRFKELTVWDRYRWQILAALAVILVQTGLIVGLVLSRRRLQVAQTSLRNEFDRRTQAETTVSRLRSRLARFSKEHSLGTMATSISHEINQPLIAIQNYAQAAKRRLQSNVDDKPKLIELFEKIEGQAERAGAITQRVRSLVNRSDLQLRSVAPAALLEEVIRIMAPEAENRGCRIQWEFAGDLPPVLADSLQVQLVLVNLLQNAMQSTNSGDEYETVVSVDVRPVDEGEVQVSVTDRGRGVPPDRVTEIFEPLYSGTSDGMGMGLAISRAIIDAHGGRLWYEPNSSGGAIFRFTLRTVGS